MSIISLAGQTSTVIDLSTTSSSNSEEEAPSSSTARIKLSSSIYTKLGTCMPPSADVGSVLTVSKYIAAYGVKGGNCRVILTKEGTATAKLNGHVNPIVDTAICSDGKPGGYSTLATLSGDGMCRLWEVANQESGGELDAREMLSLRSKQKVAQRVFFHPNYLVDTPVVYILHGPLVSGFVNNRELRDDFSSGAKLVLERKSTYRFENKHAPQGGKVLDMCFEQDESSGAWLAATAHENGTVCVWNLNVSSDAAPLHVIECGKSPVLSVNLISGLVLVGNERNCRISLWRVRGGNHEAIMPTMLQTVQITRPGGPPLRSFRSTLVKRLSDHTNCLALFESRSHDVVLLHILRDPMDGSVAMCRAVLAKVNHTVLCVTGDHDIERDLLLCHVVDVDSIGDLTLPGHAAFGSTSSFDYSGRPPRESIALLRRLSKRPSKQSLVAATDFSQKNKLGCCSIC